MLWQTGGPELRKQYCLPRLTVCPAKNPSESRLRVRQLHLRIGSVAEFLGEALNQANTVGRDCFAYYCDTAPLCCKAARIGDPRAVVHVVVVPCPDRYGSSTQSSVLWKPAILYEKKHSARTVTQKCVGFAIVMATYFVLCRLRLDASAHVSTALQTFPQCWIHPRLTFTSARCSPCGIIPSVYGTHYFLRRTL